MHKLTIVSWYNFRTGEYDDLAGAPDDYTDYIPQSRAAQNMYSLLLEMGHSKEQAALKVLSASLPKVEGNNGRPSS